MLGEVHVEIDKPVFVLASYALKRTICIQNPGPFDQIYNVTSPSMPMCEQSGQKCINILRTYQNDIWQYDLLTKIDSAEFDAFYVLKGQCYIQNNKNILKILALCKRKSSK